MSFELNREWSEFLKAELNADYFKHLQEYLKLEYKKHIVYPALKDIFSAFNYCKLSDVKVIVVGQDPYHGHGQANGLSFSVNSTVKIPPSLNNIFKELSSDLNIQKPKHGNLKKWANQGVLLLNSTLTVRDSAATSHQNKGWEQFTDAILSKLSEEKTCLVFILWGSYAQKKEYLLKSNNHLVLKSVHPSPLSAHRGFFGCRHFSSTNKYLIKHGKKAIDWSLD